VTPHQFVVSPDHSGIRVDRFLAAAQSELSRSRIQSLIDEGAVSIGDTVVKASQKVLTAQVVHLTVPDVRASELKSENIQLAVIHEDAFLLVVNKVAGMVVHPGAAHHSGTLVNALLHHVKDLRGVGGVERPGLVHRLDKDTSGLLVVAKDERTLKALQLAFQNRIVEKKYLALVLGQPNDFGEFDTLFGRHPKRRQEFSSKVKTGKPALTEYKVLERFVETSLVEVTLHTGRTHQIRVHFSDAGFPLIGDEVYGSKKSLKISVIGRQALHAATLAFVHPKTKKKMKFEAPLPPDFADAIKRLRKELLPNRISKATR
jgi:23S rRNA pseudouridine1911/1915/1917 synthase